MRIDGNPIEHLRLDAIDKVNKEFSRLLLDGSHRAAAHARKRELASMVVTLGLTTVSPAFQAEATLRGLTPEEFASLILSKDCDIDRSELQRQKVLALVDKATTQAELDAALKEIFNG